MTAVSRIKIYGERNTGTNYLTKLLERNLSVDLLPSSAPLSRRLRIPWRIARRLPLSKSLRFAVWNMDQNIEERMEDRWSERHFKKYLGWKHMRVDVARLAPLVTPDLGIVFLVKHPYPWLLSLHKNPYVRGRQPTDFSDFLQKPIRIQARHQLPKGDYRPAELWNINVGAYLSALEALPRTLLLHSEALLDDPQAELNRLIEAWNLQTLSDLETELPSTKREARSTRDYRDYYVNERWREKLSPEHYRIMNETLDADLVARSGYALTQV